MGNEFGMVFGYTNIIYQRTEFPAPVNKPLRCFVNIRIGAFEQETVVMKCTKSWNEMQTIRLLFNFHLFTFCFDLQKHDSTGKGLFSSCAKLNYWHTSALTIEATNSMWCRVISELVGFRQSQMANVIGFHRIIWCSSSFTPIVVTIGRFQAVSAQSHSGTMQFYSSFISASSHMYFTYTEGP